MRASGPVFALFACALGSACGGSAFQAAPVGASAGTAGSEAAGSSGHASGGESAGATVGGEAGASGSGGAIVAGSGGAIASGNGGAPASGNGGTTASGNGGTTASGNGGAPASGNGGTTASGNGGATAGGNGGAAGAPASILYVNGMHDGSLDGLTPQTPVQTIAEALVLAASMHAITEIRVCDASADTQPVSLTLPVSMHGGFACDFTEPGAPTTLQATAGGSPVTLEIVGAVITSSVEVSGFTIVAPDTAGASAVLIRDNAAVTVRNDTITGGKGINTDDKGTGSVGVTVASASPTLHDDMIDGGNGSAPYDGNGSIGLVIDPTSKVTSHDNTITGGSGVVGNGSGDGGGVGSTAVRTFGTFTSQTDTIDGGHGAAMATGKLASVGVFAVGAVTIAGAVLEGGRGVPMTTPGSGPVREGLLCFGQCTVNASRVGAGDSPGVYATLYGIVVAPTGQLVLTSSIVAGATSTASTFAATNGAIYAIGGTTGTPTVTLYENTIVGGYEAVQVGQRVALLDTTGPVALDVHGNFFLASGDAGTGRTIGVALACPTTITRFDANVFSRFREMNSDVVGVATACAPKTGDLNLTDFEMVVGTGGKKTPDMLLQPMALSAPPDNGLTIDFPPAMPSDAMSSYVAGWTDPAAGQSLFRTRTQFHLAAGLPCPFQKLDSDPATMTDDFGTTRGKTTTPGAEQLDPMCKGP